MSDRVPRSVWDREMTPTDPCGEHCRQSARIDRLGEWLQHRAETEDERHHALLAAITGVRSDLSSLQRDVVRIATAGAETAVAVVAEQTQRVRALHLVDAGTESEPPRRARSPRLPLWALRSLAGLGAVAGTAWAAYEAAKR
jgi:hypothetical protein